MKTVTPSPAFAAIGGLCLLLGIISAILGVSCYATSLLMIACIFLAVGLLCMIVWYSIRITFSANSPQWTLRRWFFPKKHYMVEDIHSMTFGTAVGGFTLHLSHRRLRIGRYAKNGTEFRAWVEKGYLRAHQKPIPYEPPRLFHNNVSNPWGLLISAILIGLLLLALAVCGTVSFLSPRGKPDLTDHSALVQAVERNIDYVQMTTDLGDFRAPAIGTDRDWEEYSNSMVMIQIAEQEGLIWEMTDENGTVLFTSEDTYRYLTRLDRRNMLLLWIVALTYWLLFSTSCYILNNAKKYPRLAALLVRPEKRNFST